MQCVNSQELDTAGDNELNSVHLHISTHHLFIYANTVADCYMGLAVNSLSV